MHVDGAWRKATPTFNDTLCAKVGVAPLDFDGHTDALLHPFDGEAAPTCNMSPRPRHLSRRPAKFLMREMARDYANMQGEDLSGRDMERKAEGRAEDTPTARPTRSLHASNTERSSASAVKACHIDQRQDRRGDRDRLRMREPPSHTAFPPGR